MPSSSHRRRSQLLRHAPLLALLSATGTSALPTKQDQQPTLSAELLASAPDKNVTSINPGWVEHADDCTIVVNLHVRKCGGTSVRNLFQKMSADGWTQSGMYCDPALDHATKWHHFKGHKDQDCESNPVNGCQKKSSSGKYWMEVHCKADLVEFNLGIAALREKAEPYGCRVISTLLLRDPVEQVVSEWDYFYSKLHVESPPGHPHEWMSPPNGSVANFVNAHPEEELWLLTTSENSRYLWDDPKDASGSKTPEYNLQAYHNLLDCDAALELLELEANKIDLVHRMDTPEEFAAFWIELGTQAGFSVGDTSSDDSFVFNEHNATATNLDLSEAELKTATKINKCSSKLVERLTDPWRKPPYAAASTSGVHTESRGVRRVGSVPASKEQMGQLLSFWGGREVVRHSLDHVVRSDGQVDMRQSVKHSLFVNN